MKKNVWVVLICTAVVLGTVFCGRYAYVKFGGTVNKTSAADDADSETAGTAEPEAAENSKELDNAEDLMNVYNVQTTGGNLNVRSAPSADAQIVTKFANGSLCTATGNSQDGWVELSLDDGTTGWVSAEFLAAAADHEADVSQSEASEEDILQANPTVTVEAAPEIQYCSQCGGTGQIMSDNTSVCAICGGTGQQYIPNLYYDVNMGWMGGYMGCSGCGGSGYLGSVSYSVCPTCNGTGVLS